MKRILVLAISLFVAMLCACRYIPVDGNVNQPVNDQGGLLVFLADSVEYRTTSAAGEIVSGLRDVRVYIRVAGRNPAYFDAKFSAPRPDSTVALTSLYIRFSDNDSTAEFYQIPRYVPGFFRAFKLDRFGFVTGTFYGRLEGIGRNAENKSLNLQAGTLKFLLP